MALVMTGVVPAEPAYYTIAGVEVVTIPVWHYAELLECQRAMGVGRYPFDQARTHPALVAVDPRSRLFGDFEVAVFLFEAFGRVKLTDAVVACRQRFGIDRSPSKATIGRYWQRLRRP